MLFDSCRFVLPLALSLVFSMGAVASSKPPLIPLPSSIEWKSGEFELGKSTRIACAGKGTLAEGQTLAEMLRPATGLKLPVVSGMGRKGDIILADNLPDEESFGKEGYRISITPDNITISSASGATAGLFYGGQTLRQLLPPEIYSKRLQKAEWKVPCCHIEDSPRFAWRGYMLDYSRHFLDKAYTKHLLDAMAINKMNVFHMHLTDDDGWRIEIKKYPKLTEIGAWRGTECVLPNTRKGEKFKRYGGYLTQDDIREIVAYAAKLHINIMPEIDMPGHCLAICTAYPETLPTKMGEGVSVQGHKANAISPAKENNYKMVDDIIGEVAELFPFDYVHIGGDEVNHSLWKEDPEIKAFMQKNKIGNLRGAQVYFTKRLEGILAKHNKKMIGWNEIFNNELLRTTGIMSWIGTGPGYSAAKRGFPVVMAPGQYNYFDMGYPGSRDEPPAHWWAGKIDCSKCYSFNPLGGPGLNAEQAARIMGVHGCLWTEFVKPWQSKTGWMEFKTYGEAADYKTFPRLCALAEVGWSQQDLRKFSDFADRLGPTHLRRLRNAGVTLRVPLCGAVIHKGLVYILPPYKDAEIRYTTDGSDPLNSKTVKIWNGKPFKTNASKLRARTWLDGIPGPLHAGAKLEAVGKWSPAMAGKDFKTHDFDISGSLDEPGVWRIGFRKTGGRQHILVEKVELLINGKVIAEDAHAGGSAKGPKYKFTINQPIAQGAKVVLRVSMKANNPKNKRINSHGEITLEKSEYLEPSTTVKTAISPYGSNSADKLADYDRSSFFWSSRSVRKGETILFSFDEPIMLKSIEAVSGKPDDPTRDILQNGILEISGDGKNFKKAATFAYGKAEAKLNGKSIKAVRITVTADNTESWMIMQDLFLK